MNIKRIRIRTFLKKVPKKVRKKYQLQLPDKSVLQKKLQELINMPLLEEGE